MFGGHDPLRAEGLASSVCAIDSRCGTSWAASGESPNSPCTGCWRSTRDDIRSRQSLYAREISTFSPAKRKVAGGEGFTASSIVGYGPRDGVAGMRRNLALVRTVRDVIGSDAELMADAYMGWDVGYAIRMIRMIEDAGLNLAWVEEPLIPDDIEGTATVRRAVQTPISGGEHSSRAMDFAS